MHLDLVAEIWSELKRYIGTIDRSEAADSFISMLIDHDYSTEDIRTTFKSDSDIKKALVNYIQDDSEQQDEDEEYEEEEDWDGEDY
jgi:hypothetical protein